MAKKKNSVKSVAQKNTAPQMAGLAKSLLMNAPEMQAPAMNPPGNASANISPVLANTSPQNAGLQKAGISKTGQLEHPLLQKAREQARAGEPAEAANTLEALAKQMPPFEQAQLYSIASQFLRVQDKPRAVKLAIEATKAGPELGQTWLALANIYEEQRARPEAISAALKAMGAKIQPKELVDIGRLLSRLGEDQKALEAVTKGYQLSGEDITLSSYTLRVALQVADWELANKITTKLQAEHDAGKTKEVGETPRTHLLWCADEATNIKVISAFAEKNFPIQAPLITKAWPDGAKRKLRIGYLSSDYRDHATSLLAMGMMRHHDKERFEFYAYCTSYDDGSALRRDMLSRFHHARTLSSVNDKVAAQQIVKDKIDVLVDLNGLTEGTRHGILAQHPAPVQICYLGFPGTVGGRFVDYIVGDAHTIPPGIETLYPEQVIRIPPTYQINDYHARYLPPPPTRKKLGLPTGVPIIGMFNNVNKVGSAVWDTWLEILKQAPHAIFWMLDPGVVAKGFLMKAAAAKGVAENRFIFAPKMGQEPHIARLQQCDIVVDPWPYGGHTTTSDALFAGIPVVALEGTNFASRVSGGLLRAAGLGSLVQPDIPSYIKMVTALLQKPDEIIKMKRFVMQMKSRLALFDAPQRTRQLEAAYVEAYNISARGLPAHHFEVNVSPKKTAPAPATAPADAKPTEKAEAETKPQNMAPANPAAESN
jgi:predicted O-linked N-acetylglucosamine transferase (SPINDLY family)